jgi:ABC-type nitrate/sulfonate/bicarbonate transport system substrate-binding protein
MSMPELTAVNAGFLPLLDASLLVVAREKGFAASHGLDLRLHKETSWANIRDRLAIGHFDVAHLLAPMPIAAALSGGPMDPKLIVPMALGLGGNAVTVSKQLWAEMAPYGVSETGDAVINGKALALVCKQRNTSKQSIIRLAVVHRHSSHNLELRFWLAASGAEPDVDVEFVVVPPPFMVDALQSGEIDGFCVGEPWNTLAVDRDAGVIATTKSQIWRGSPEKVLGVRAAWADDHPDSLQGLVRAIAEASAWAGKPENKTEIAAILSRPEYLDMPEALLLAGLTGNLRFKKNADVQRVYDFLLLNDQAATFPWASHALWFYAQMVRWGMFEHSPEAAITARKLYRPDIYRQCLAGTDMPLPNASLKVEGGLTEPTDVPTTQGKLTLGPDGFFDGSRFDPDLLVGYLAEYLPKKPK